MFINNTADYGGAIASYDVGQITFEGNSSVVFVNNTAYHGGAIGFIGQITFEGNSSVVFVNNTAADYGGAIESSNSQITFDGNSSVVFVNNTADGGGAIGFNGQITFEGNSSVVFVNNTADGGGAVRSTGQITFEGNSSVVFVNNTADYSGAIRSTGQITFEGNSSVVFVNNTADDGGTIGFNGQITFEWNSSVVFVNNTADGGGAIRSTGQITFEGNSSVVFVNNTADDGGAIGFSGQITFEGNSSVVFVNNTAANFGGAILSYSNGQITFEGNSSVVFVNNTATNFGGAILSFSNGQITFEGNSSVVFVNNTADDGGAIRSNGQITFEGNSSVVFVNNTADDGGAIRSNGQITFEGNSSVVFVNNTAAGFGGAIGSRSNSQITFQGNSSIMFVNNTADYGGAVYCDDNKYNVFGGNSTIEFNNNVATYNGGAIYCFTSNTSFEEFSATVFKHNTADYGGAVSAEIHSNIMFSENSTVTFTKNKATFGAATYSNGNSKIIKKGNSTIVFDEISARWCSNTCLPYTGQNDTVTVDGDGIVWCSNQEAFVCQNINCHCKNLKELLSSVDDTSDTLIDIEDKVITLSSVVHLVRVYNISIIGHNNPTVICVNGGRLSLSTVENVIIKGITWIGCGGYSNIHTPVILLDSYVYGVVHIQKCSFQHSIAPVIRNSKNPVSPVYADITINIINCNFINNNHYRGHGIAVLYLEMNFYTSFTIQNCSFCSNGPVKGIVYISKDFEETIEHSQLSIQNSDFINNQGMPLYLRNYMNIQIKGEVTFGNNSAKNGAGIFIGDYSTATFDQNSSVTFVNNFVTDNGAAIFLSSHSNVIFKQGAVVKFHYNKATSGTIYSKSNSKVTFTGNCEVTFNSNSATQYGAAICSLDNSHVIFTGSSKVTFNNNIVVSGDHNIDQPLGGIIYSNTRNYVSFEGNSITEFNNNIANFGAAILTSDYSKVIFKDRSRVMFNSNIAQTCGTLTSTLFSTITFDDNTQVTYDTNTVSSKLRRYDESSAGAICTFKRAHILFSGHSFISFINNTADRGGAVAFSESNVTIQEYFTMTFNNNIALYSSGGAIECFNNSNIIIKGNSNLTVSNNKAIQNGGAIYSHNLCQIIFKENSTSQFVNNNARNNGGAVAFSESNVTIQEYSTITFNNNIALYSSGGAIECFNNSKIIVKGNSNVIVSNNKAIQNGGAIYSHNLCQIIFKENSSSNFVNNNARNNGGVIFNSQHFVTTFKGNSKTMFAKNTADNGGTFYATKSTIIFEEASLVSFYNNEALRNGGVGYFSSSSKVTFQGNTAVRFDSNRALDGGVILADNYCKFVFKENSTALFYSNMATVGGGAMEVINNSNVILMDYTTINFMYNAAQYGAAIFMDTTAVIVNNCGTKCINFTNNIAKILGNFAYQDITESFNKSGIMNRTEGIGNDLIATPPKELKLYDPAICIDNDNESQCNNYLVQNIMLGTEIVVPTCVYNHYNYSVNSTQFLVQTKNTSIYSMNAPKEVLLSCDVLKGITITGNQMLLKSTNFSINITLNTALNPDWKKLSVYLTIELLPCHPGFWQFPRSEKCECYDVNDIVFCSGSSSTIKRGFWFGSVIGKPTITFCPINYCNFTCCETTNGYYHLSPFRDNQCRSHRSGAACGSCEEGYTLSFDSVECIHVNECTIGWTIIILILIVFYWIVIIATVFTVMHSKVEIGYLYAITFYYSVVDILLNHNWYLSSELYTTINAISSFAKITPQFLGQFCFITNMSGIDQQFIHYIHPVAISLFLIMITVLARRSYWLSSFISKGIINVICCLLLLSYTSLATTSLLLMRPLIFQDVDQIFTYLSPDVEYFHGRHLAYAIVAIIFTVIFVLGLPLLLALEPFVNSKINFIKVKPLLDQFQGCYKDRCRYFAAYYMICRLVITIIVIFDPSNDFILQYLLISFCVVIALIHQNLRPYSSSTLNLFDGIILHFLVLVSVLQLGEFFNDFNSNLIVGITIILITLPLMIFITMTLILNKEKIRRLPGYCYSKCSQLHYNQIAMNEIEESSDEEEHVNVIDDSTRSRVNVTVCDM